MKVLQENNQLPVISVYIPTTRKSICQTWYERVYLRASFRCGPHKSQKWITYFWMVLFIQFPVEMIETMFFFLLVFLFNGPAALRKLGAWTTGNVCYNKPFQSFLWVPPLEQKHNAMYLSYWHLNPTSVFKRLSITNVFTCPSLAFLYYSWIPCWYAVLNSLHIILSSETTASVGIIFISQPFVGFSSPH